jgi:hypothetical protein
MSTENWNPVKVEEGIRDVSNRIAEGVSVCNKRYRAFLDADRDFDAAFARAYLAHEGPAHEKKYAAELATQKERKARDEADAIYRYADRQARALENELRALQSVGASIRSMYQVAGRGES